MVDNLETENGRLRTALAAREKELREMAEVVILMRDAREIALFVDKFQDALPSLSPVAAAQRVISGIAAESESMVLEKIIQMGEESLSPDRFEWLKAIAGDLRNARKNIIAATDEIGESCENWQPEGGEHG
jgi:hypothetical protein